MLWTDKNVLITGASRGLGFALAQELGSRGAKVAIVSRNAPRLTSAAERLEALGIAVHAIRADLGDKEDIHRIVGQAQALLGPIDVLIHNASTLGPSPLIGLLDTECEDLTRALEVNLMGPFRLTRALAAGMLVRGSGLLVHVSSDAALEPYPDWGAYGVSKAALDRLARQWASELSGTEVRVLSIDPGEMNTDMHREALPDAKPETLLSAATVAARFVRIFEDPARFPSGSRVLASAAAPTLEVAP
jgi:NAD(P)-dependent dehydrogenase (short-subunit alcohol dehydrogenase family)